MVFRIFRYPEFRTFLYFVQIEVELDFGEVDLKGRRRFDPTSKHPPPGPVSGPTPPIRTTPAADLGQQPPAADEADPPRPTKCGSATYRRAVPRGKRRDRSSFSSTRHAEDRSQSDRSDRTHLWRPNTVELVHLSPLFWLFFVDSSCAPAAKGSPSDSNQQGFTSIPEPDPFDYPGTPGVPGLIRSGHVMTSSLVRIWTNSQSN